MLLSDHIGVGGTTLRVNKEYVRLMKGYFSDGMAVHCNHGHTMSTYIGKWHREYYKADFRCPWCTGANRTRKQTVS